MGKWSPFRLEKSPISSLTGVPTKFNEMLLKLKLPRGMKERVKI